MDYTQRPTFNDAIAEVRNEMLRLQVRIDEYNKAYKDRDVIYTRGTRRERGAVRRASLDLSAALVKLRKASV
jgi:hypothetical protein